MKKRSAEEQNAFNVGLSTEKRAISDEELSEIVNYYKITISFFEGMNGTGYYGLILSNLRQGLDWYQSIQIYRRS